MYCVFISYILTSISVVNTSNLPLNVLTEINSNLNNPESRMYSQVNGYTRDLIHNNPMTQISEIMNLIQNLTDKTCNETIIHLQQLSNDLIHKQSYVYYDKLIDITMKMQNKIYEMKHKSLSKHQVHRLFAALNIYSSPMHSIPTLVSEISHHHFTVKDACIFLLSVVSRETSNLFLDKSLLPDAIVVDNASNVIISNNERNQHLETKRLDLFQKDYICRFAWNFKVVTLCKYLMESVFDTSSFLQRQQFIHNYHVIPWDMKTLKFWQQRCGLQLLALCKNWQGNNLLNAFEHFLSSSDDILKFYLPLIHPMEQDPYPLTPAFGIDNWWHKYCTRRMHAMETYHSTLLTRFKVVCFMELFNIYKSNTMQVTMNISLWQHFVMEHVLDLAYQLFIEKDICCFEKLIVSLCPFIGMSPFDWLQTKVMNQGLHLSMFPFMQHVMIKCSAQTNVRPIVGLTNTSVCTAIGIIGDRAPNYGWDANQHLAQYQQEIGDNNNGDNENDNNDDGQDDLLDID
eukprot:264714_1